ncbi:MAG TPA: hypothetical protein VMV18_06865 [bacterium]|nr:hypothetical protein [bacterium]
MSDAEWDSWQSAWKGATGPLPDVRARARAMARRHRLDNLGGLGMILFGFGVSIWLIASGRRHDTIIGIIDLAFCITILAGFFWIQRGVGAPRIGNPRDALAFLERRIRAERRGAWFGAPAYLLLFAFAGSISHQAVDDLDWPVRLFVTIVLVLGLSLTAALPWIVYRRTRAQQDEVVRWRAWLDEQHL